jgi:hypothetical protein
LEDLKIISKRLSFFHGYAQQKKWPLKGCKHADNLYRFQISAQPPAKKTAGLVEKETEVSYDLNGIRLRAQEAHH